MTLRKCFTIILISFSVCVSFIAGCSSEQLPAHEEAREYVINQRTGKIHDPSCSSVSLMSEKNKLIVSDTLLNLLKQDYVICRRCRAGVKKPGTSGALDRILHANLYTEDVKITASREDYLNAIDEMGEWYVNHVPTYASGIQEESFSKYDGKLRNYKKYELKNKGKSSTYLVLSSDTGSPSTSHLKSGTQILRGTENAASNYQKYFDQIDFERRIAYYPCDLLSQASDYN